MKWCKALSAGLLACLVAQSAPSAQAAAVSELDNPFRGLYFLRNWWRTSKYAQVRRGVLLLDSLRTREFVAVFRREKAYWNVHMVADFCVERLGKDGQTFGLIVGSTDSQNYHALEFERRKVSLIRVAEGQTVQTLATRGIRDHIGTVQRGRLECTSTLVRAYYGPDLLLTVKAPQLKEGLIGVYARAAQVWVYGLEFVGTRTRLRRPWRLHPEQGPTTRPPAKKPQPTQQEPAPAKAPAK